MTPLEFREDVWCRVSYKNLPGDCTLQCGIWLWNHNSEFTKWQHPVMWYVALVWHAMEFAHTMRRGYHRLRGSASTVNGDRPSQWEMANFDHLQNRNPWADCHKIPHNWLCPREDPLNQIWYKSNHGGGGGFWGNGWNITFLCLVMYTFFLRLAHRSDRLMDFYAW